MSQDAKYLLEYVNLDYKEAREDIIALNTRLPVIVPFREVHLCQGHTIMGTTKRSQKDVILPISRAAGILECLEGELVWHRIR